MTSAASGPLKESTYLSFNRPFYSDLLELPSAPTRRGRNQARVLAVACSLALHAGLIGWYWTAASDSAPRLAAIERVLDLVFVEPPSQPMDSAPSQEAQPLVPREVITVAPTKLASQPAPKTTADPSREAPTRLNLQRPDHWEVLVLDPPDQDDTFGFRKSTREALAERREEQNASRALSRAQISRLGLPAEEFRQLTDSGETVKTSKGCFVKREELGPSGRQERWWRTRCNDARQPQWRRDVLSYGPDHRVNAPQDGKSDCPNGRCWAY